MKGGRLGEELVLEKLREAGAICEIIETKMRLGRIGGRVVLMPDSGKKLGDIYGLMRGKGLLVEVKSYDQDRLQYSILKDHQHKSLRDWSVGGGIAMVGWVRGKDVRLIEYPLGWLPGTSIQ